MTPAQAFQRFSTVWCAADGEGVGDPSCRVDQIAFDMYRRAVQGDARLIDTDGACRPLDDYRFSRMKIVEPCTSADLRSGLQFCMPFDLLLQVAADTYLVVGGYLVVAMITDRFYAVLGYLEDLVAAHIVECVLTDDDPFVITHGLSTVMPNADRLVVIDLFVAVMADLRGLIMLDHIVLVLLRMDEHFLLPQLILEAQFIEPLALVGLALDRHARLVLGQFVGR